MNISHLRILITSTQAGNHFYNCYTAVRGRRMSMNKPPPARLLARMLPPVALTWRPPYDAVAVLTFLAQRQLPGVEWVQPEALSLHRTVRLVVGGQVHTGWLIAQLQPAAHRLELRTSDSLHAVLPSLLWRVRALFDLDADPQAINAVLHPHFPQGDGLRVPGAFDGFELAVRAVLGQQVTVAVRKFRSTNRWQLCAPARQPMETLDMFDWCSSNSPAKAGWVERSSIRLSRRCTTGACKASSASSRE